MCLYSWYFLYWSSPRWTTTAPNQRMSNRPTSSCTLHLHPMHRLTERTGMTRIRLKAVVLDVLLGSPVTDERSSTTTSTSSLLALMGRSSVHTLTGALSPANLCLWAVRGFWFSDGQITLTFRKLSLGHSVAPSSQLHGPARLPGLHRATVRLVRGSAFLVLLQSILPTSLAS